MYRFGLIQIYYRTIISLAAKVIVLSLTMLSCTTISKDKLKEDIKNLKAER